MKPLDLTHTIVEALEDKKGENIILLDVHEITSFTDYFVICTGSSSRMLDALAEGVREKVRKGFNKKARTHGSSGTGWIVLDYGDIVIHLFDEELRGYYRLEDLWKEGKILLRLQ